MSSEGIDANERARAGAVVWAFANSLVLGLALLVFFEPDVQQAGAAELVERRDDARAFFAADYVFILLYAVLSPLAIRRYGSTIAAGPPWWLTAAVVLLPLAGLADAVENTLLISATDSPSPGTVDAAHLVAIPKLVLFAGGAGCAVAVLVRAIRELR